MQNKDFTANGKESAVFSSRKPFQMCVYTVYSREYGKACGDLYWKHCTSTPHRSEKNGTAERAGTQGERSYTRGTSVIWSGSKMTDSMEICETFKTSCLTGKLLMNSDLVNHFKDW